MKYNTSISGIVLIGIGCLFFTGCTEDDPEIKITSFSFNTASVEAVEGTTVDLNDYLTIAGEDASQAEVVFTTDNEEVVTVSGSTLSATAVGKAQIEATETNTNQTATIDVTVIAKLVEVTGITLSASSLSVDIGGTGSLIATVTPENATNKNVIWTLDEDEGSPETFASIDSETGIVTGVSECDACGLSLAATSEDGGFTAKADLNIVYVPVTSITLTPSSFSVDVGGTQQMTPTILPANASNKNVTWSVDVMCDAVGSDYATVSATGLVTGVAPEVCDLVVIATAENETDVSETALVIVNPILITSLVIRDSDGLPYDDKAVELDGCVFNEYQLYTTILPTNATDKTVTWSVVSGSGMTVNSSGLLTLEFEESTARIAATANDNSGFSDYVDVSVTLICP